MPVRVSRTIELDVSQESAWDFISDPAQRATAISVVDSYETQGDVTLWRVRMPIPVLNRTITVETRDVQRDPPRYVKFTGTSRVLNVIGEHTIEKTDVGCQLVNEFVVEGKLPGVEAFFERNLNDELENLERHLRREVSSE
ncbi:MAG: SRPBCC family protein [Halobacteriaceae archaeon]